MKTIIHCACKGEIGTYSDDAISKVSDMTANKFTRTDKSNPLQGAKLNEKCPVCGRRIDSWDDMEIGQDKVKNVWN